MAPDPPRSPESEPELVEAQLVEPVPEQPRRDGVVDTLLTTTGRVLEPVARLGWRGARGVSRRLGIDRVLGRALDRSVDRALESDAAERAVERALGSDSVMRAWDKVLESDEAQKLVERVAEAPEVRSAITSQGIGLLEDVRRSARKGARRLDDGFERVARRMLRRSAASRAVGPCTPAESPAASRSRSTPRSSAASCC